MSVKIFSVNLAVLLLSLSSLTACKQEYTESYYFAHPEVLKSALRQCQLTQEIPEAFDARCKLAYNSALHMQRLINAFIESQAEFGQRILRAELHLAELQNELRIAEKAHLPTVLSLKKQVSHAKQEVDRLLAVVGLFVQT